MPNEDKEFESLNLSVGSTVFSGNRRYVITAILDTERLAARSTATGETKRFHITELSSTPADPDATLEVIPKVELELIPDKNWVDAHNKAMMFAEVLQQPIDLRRKKLNEVAEKIGITEPTAYKWLKKFKETKDPLVFLPTKRGDKGQSRLNQHTEELIQEGIDRFYLTNQKIKITDLYHKLKVLKKEKQKELRKKGISDDIQLPHINTIRNRVSELTASQKAAKRNGRKGKEDYRPIIGEFPEVTKPLEVVQIDHTPLDIIIVDDEERMPIGRPTLTLAIDVYSRMIAGFYLSFEKPNALLVGCCLTHCILDKNDWLRDHEIEGEWPVFGLIDTLHTDNGKEFRSASLKKSLERYNINHALRPVRTPRYGGHVERVFRTINDQLHQLPGTTFSNIQQRGEYQSEKKAVITLREIETWLTEFIVNVYHKKKHSSLGRTPLEQWTIGIMGDGLRPGAGLPPRIENKVDLKIDFLPFKEVTVQKYGIQLNNIFYFHDVLKKWIKQPDKTRRGSQRFIVRYDPRDLSKIFFYDPDLLSYASIPYRDISHRPISIWELKAIKARLKEQQSRPVTEDDVFEAKLKMDSLVEDARKQTKLSRRNKLKESVRQAESIPSQVTANNPLTGTGGFINTEPAEPINIDDDDFDDIKPYNDVEH